MNVFFWVLQVLLAAHTVMGAVWKFSHSEQTVPSLKAVPHGVWLSMSVFELFCAAALIAPALYQPLAIAAPVAAALIAVEMLFMSAVHIFTRHPQYSRPKSGQMIYWLVVASVCTFIAYGRFVLKPL